MIATLIESTSKEEKIKKLPQAACTDTRDQTVNSDGLELELEWFNQVLNLRLMLYFEQECNYESIDELPAPDLSSDNSIYAQLIRKFDMSVEERLILLLALIPHICPQLLDTFFIPNNNINRIYTEFGGWTGSGHSGFLPTGETAIFILAGKDITKRLTIGKLFDTDHFFYKHSILHIDPPQNNEPFLSGPLIISPEYLSLITTGIQNKPDYNIHFPAKLITGKKRGKKRKKRGTDLFFDFTYIVW